MAVSSASSWGCELKCGYICLFPRQLSQPLREAVSWNEINPVSVSECTVSLFVRLWVEIRVHRITSILRHCQPLREAVSWNKKKSMNNKNLNRQPLREAVSWNWFSRTFKSVSAVSLFVRLWVEIVPYLFFLCAWLSASSWGCELKCFENRRCICHKGQPLREAVSWNTYSSSIRYIFSLSASSWGCELKYFSYNQRGLAIRQPLREAVSWNTLTGKRCLNSSVVSLFVRLWVEIVFFPRKHGWNVVSLFVRLWVEIVSLLVFLIPYPSASSWGCELKYN